ncbi:hypothetical protein CSKR_109464 [Clonorchis sinensis]|uniref:Uncharacterized protein n=1 Tax=Clonorchis sinensis TaxID=79923 RepID=A0A3R7CQW2_CLOSI|nr:hypothetical protein CSKR_109464 [Clonorchis sinensis]
MILRDDVSLESDEGLLSVANYALKLLRKEPCLKKPIEVSASFIIRLAVDLFGSDILPYPRASCFLHYYENLVSVLRILSSEIGIELDHIDPREVLRGSRRSVSNLLEIITAFILHCVRGNLLDFEDVPHSAETFKKDRVIEESPLGIDLSHSPELPRSVGRVYTAPPCVRNLTDCSPTLTKSTYDSGLPRTFATGDTVTQLSRVTRISSDTQSLFASGKADVVTKQHTPSPGSHYPRLPSILSMQLPVSPPTTPKDADNIMEIVRHPSPQSAAPSLSSSPVNRLPRESQNQSAPLDVQVDKPLMLMSRTSTAVHPTTLDSTAPSFFHSDEDQTKYRLKGSSSSSGCGPSPSPTVPAASTSSASSSLCESAPLQATPLITESTSPGLPKSVFPRGLRHPRRHSDGPSSDECSCPTTGSILNWTKSDRKVDVADILDEFTSILSSSVQSRLDTVDPGTVRPPASVLISRTERFSKALKARLDYLRTISCRAHDEAQAVAQLVNAIGLQCSTASKIISQCNSGCMIDREKPSVCSPEVQDTLYRILMGVNILLHNQLLDSALLEQEQGKEFPTTGRKARKLPPRTRATHDARLRQVALRRATIPLDCSSDSEFNELIGIKHKLMVDALRHCRLELNSNRQSVRCPRCKILI